VESVGRRGSPHDPDAQMRYRWTRKRKHLALLRLESSVVRQQRLQRANERGRETQPRRAQRTAVRPPEAATVGAAAHLAKLPIKGLANMYKRAKLQQQIQGAYGPLTGQTVGYTPPGVGAALKSLMFSQASQQGF
jgi:hypothetical protein